MKYVCDVCGFIYDEAELGPIPADYACPLCGAEREHFKAEV